MITIFIRTIFTQGFHFLDNIHREIFCLWVGLPFATVKYCCDFIQTNVPQRYGCSTIFKDFIYCICLSQAFAECPILIENWSIGRGCLFHSFHTIDQSILSNGHAFCKDFPELILISCRLHGNSWQVDGYDTEVHTTRCHILPIFILPTLKERAAAHWHLEGTCQLNNLVIRKHIWIHTLGRTFNRQLLDVIVWRIWL